MRTYKMEIVKNTILRHGKKSLDRKICICILTYIVVIIYSLLIQKISNVLLSSLVRVIGFTLSTLSLKVIRNIWEKYK